MNQKYYERFKIFTDSPYWEKYLQWAYTTCMKDLCQLNFYPDFSGKNFTALLCGTSGERTSSIFTQYIHSRNHKARIMILDHSRIQIEQSKSMLSSNFPDANIDYLVVDALDTGILPESIDYIETDAFFEFFSLEKLEQLLGEWKRILKPGGWVTTRAFASSNYLEKRLDFIRLLVARRYLDVDIHVHYLPDITEAIRKSGLRYVQGGGAYCPTFKRFSLLKSG